MESAIRVQFLVKEIYVSLRTDNFGKDMNPFLLPTTSAIGK